MLIILNGLVLMIITLIKTVIRLISMIIKINRNKDFVRLYKKGRTQGNRHFVVFFAKNGGKAASKPSRLGISTGKKCGNAVERSRIRRIVRAAWRNAAKSSLIPKGYDVIFSAKQGAASLKSTDVQRFLETRVIPSMTKLEAKAAVKNN